MGRWSQYDTDEERLPEGMTRIGYDADDQTYTFRDADGSIWESAPGSRYGSLHRVSGPSAPPQPRDSYMYEDGNDEALLQPPPPYVVHDSVSKASWRAEMMPLFNFFMIIGLFLIGVFFYLRATATKMDQDVKAPECGTGNVPYAIQTGDTCWAIANSSGLEVDALLAENTNLDCNKLMVGQSICVPSA
ncbi:putative LysM domain-containing protein [Seiridium cardinale]